MRYYLDSAPLIYLIEEVEPYSSKLEARLASNEVIQLCSELSRLECRVKPWREGKVNLVAAFDSYFKHVIHEIVPLSATVIDLATDMRARYGFKTPDAIHLSAAIIAQCDVFLTNDYRLNRCTEIKIETL